MGRGLSDLQRRILTAAYQRRGREPVSYQVEAFWRAPEWLADLTIKLHDAQKDYWRLGFLPTRYLEKEEGGDDFNLDNNSKHKFVWNSDAFRRLIIEKAVNDAKMADDFKKMPNDYVKLMMDLRRKAEGEVAEALTGCDDDRDASFIARIRGMEYVEGFTLAEQPNLNRGFLGWWISSSACLFDVAEAEAVRDRLRVTLGGCEPFGGAWVIYSSGFGMISYNQLLVELFGFEPSGAIEGQAFDVQAIGAGRYNAARASLQRACLRLQQRGLIERHEQNETQRWYQRAGLC